MTARNVIKEIMKTQNVPNVELAKRLSVTPATVWDRLNNKKGRKDIPVSLLSEMLNVLNYRIVLIPADTPLPENGYEITVEQVE